MAEKASLDWGSHSVTDVVKWLRKSYAALLLVVLSCLTPANDKFTMDFSCDCGLTFVSPFGRYYGKELRTQARKEDRG